MRIGLILYICSRITALHKHNATLVDSALILMLFVTVLARLNYIFLSYFILVGYSEYSVVYSEYLPYSGRGWGRAGTPVV